MKLTPDDAVTGRGLMGKYYKPDPNSDWQARVTPDDASSQRRIAGIGYDGFSEEAAPSQPARNPASRTIGRWELQKRGKASHQAKHRGYVLTASAEPATPLLDRLEAGNGPVRIIVKDGMLL